MKISGRSSRHRNLRFLPAATIVLLCSGWAGYPFAPAAEAQTSPPKRTAPPPTAPPKKIAISSGVAAGLLTHKVDPVYPEEARQAGIRGTVVLHVTITTDGSVMDVESISGPDALREPAMEAVRQYIYRPYTLNGQPVQVETTVNVPFPK